MKLVTVQYNRQTLCGEVIDDRFYPASDVLMKRYETLEDLVADRATGASRATRSQPAFGIALSEVRFLPPLPNADKIICVGMNYRKPYPIAGITPPDPSNIVLFGKEHAAMLGHSEKLEIPAGKAAQSFDYEVASQW